MGMSLLIEVQNTGMVVMSLKTVNQQICHQEIHIMGLQ